MRRDWWSLPLSIVLLAACSGAGRKAAWEDQSQVKTRGVGTSSATPGLLAAADAAWAKRDDRGQLEAALASWTKVAELEPDNAAVMMMLSRGYEFLAEGHAALSGPGVDERLALHQKGADWGEKGLLKADPAFAAAMNNDGEFEQAIKAIGKPAVPAAYWYCMNLGRFANLKGLSAKLFYKERFEATMARIEELTPDYFYSGIDRFRGMLYAALPPVAGKDLSRSRKAFDRAIEAGPGFLFSKVMKADFLAVELEDHSMYTTLLEEVIKAPDGDDPDSAPENRAAKRLANRLLNKASARF